MPNCFPDQKELENTRTKTINDIAHDTLNIKYIERIYEMSS